MKRKKKEALIAVVLICFSLHRYVSCLQMAVPRWRAVVLCGSMLRLHLCTRYQRLICSLLCCRSSGQSVDREKSATDLMTGHMWHSALPRFPYCERDVVDFFCYIHEESNVRMRWTPANGYTISVIANRWHVGKKWGQPIRYNLTFFTEKVLASK